MRNRPTRTWTRTRAWSWVVVTIGSAVAAFATLSPVAQHVVHAAIGGTGENHNELLGI